MIVSVVVIAYNEQDNLPHTVAALLAQTADCDLEVLIVNDGSRDATLAVADDLHRQDQRVRVVDLGVNQGRGAARAAGVDAATGSYIAFVDADIVVPPDWISVCLDNIDDVVACGGTAVPDGDVTWTHRAFALFPRTVAHTVAVTGSNGLFRREVFDLIGFDASLRQGEDVALNREMDRLGLVTRTIPGLLVEHHETKTFAESARWLFVSGVGATRHLLAARRIRTPDLAFAGFVALTSAAVLLTLTGPARWGTLAACAAAGYLLAVSALHLSRKFHVRRAPVRTTAATVAHAGLLLAYFAGRAVGLVHRPTAA